MLCVYTKVCVYVPPRRLCRRQGLMTCCLASGGPVDAEAHAGYPTNYGVPSWILCGVWVADIAWMAIPEIPQGSSLTGVKWPARS